MEARLAFVAYDPLLVTLVTETFVSFNRYLLQGQLFDCEFGVG